MLHAAVFLTSAHLRLLRRTEILACHGLKFDYFDSMQQAWDAADKLVQRQREELPQDKCASIPPDDIVEGWPQLDRFYYIDFQGHRMQAHAISKALQFALAMGPCNMLDLLAHESKPKLTYFQTHPSKPNL